MSNQNSHHGCNACNKSSLSLLLLRASPIATHSDLCAPGSENTVPFNGLVQTDIPSGLTNSRPVLRLLRAGYVHLYVPKNDEWRTWRVTNQADMLAQDHPSFGTPSVDAACSRPGHNAPGFKLLQIPRAHELIGQPVWLAFSANLWNDKLKAQNRANPKAMVQVTLGSAGTSAFKPDAFLIKRHVLECNVRRWHAPRVDPELTPMFSFTSLSTDEDVQRLVAALQNAAAAHPKTVGRELAVVLPDPVGYAAEVNAIRLMAEKRGLQPSTADQHKLFSHYALQGLAKNVADVRAVDTYAPVIPKREFDRLTRGRPDFMKGKWVSLDGTTTIESYALTPPRVSQDALGRYWMAGREELVAQKLPEFRAKATKQIESGYDAAASESWVKAYEERARAALEPFERQWMVARKHAAVESYFSTHFDPAEANKAGPLVKHCSGSAYCNEVSLIDGPAPKTSVALLDEYMEAYYRDPNDPRAFSVRAMVANQQSLFAVLAKQLGGDPNGDEESGGMRDKSVDFIKGFLDVKGEQFRAKFSWLTAATMSFAMGPMFYGAAAVGTYLTLGGSDFLKTRPKAVAFAMRSAAWVGGMNTALKSAVAGKVVRPVLLQFWIEEGLVNHAIRGPDRFEGWQGARPGPSAENPIVNHPIRSPGEIEGWMGARPGGRKLVTLLTDTERVAQSGGQLNDLLAAASGRQVAYGKSAGAALAAGHTGAIVLDVASGLTSHQGAALFAKQVEEARAVAGTVRAAIPTGTHAVTMSLDGRLALASVIVQTIGIINGRAQLQAAEAKLAAATSEDERAEQRKKVRDAQYAFMDSFGGLVAGSLDTLRVAGEAMNLQRGVAHGGSIHVLKFGAQVAGVFGGFLNGYVSYLKVTDARERGLVSVSRLHLISSASFVGTGLTAGAPIAATGLQYLAARQIGGVAVQRMAGAAAGAWIPFAGWVLLGAGVVATVGAALLEPSQIEAWARQTPFGKGPNDKKFKTLDEQSKALHTALGLAAAPAPVEDKAA